MQREKLEALLDRAKPILCPACLTEQLRKWRAKYDSDYPQIVCAECGGNFRLGKSKVEAILSKGKNVLCRDCLEIKLKSNSTVRLRSIPQASDSGWTLWKFIGRIANGYFV
jgi:DNA-directed RNA polymerase subunit RPC12/RpoP